MRNARFDDGAERQRGYKTERAQRWTLESALREPVMALLCQRLEKNHQQQTCLFAPYADRLIEEYQQAHPYEHVPNVIRGAPDFTLEVNGKKHFVELKIKTTRFRNTVRGNGGSIPNYGCESNYLDREPVYANTVLHARKLQLPLERVWFLFALNPNAKVNMELPLRDADWHFECINLESLQRHVLINRYAVYAGGYGQAAYLIRCDDMSDPLSVFA